MKTFRKIFVECGSPTYDDDNEAFWFSWESVEALFRGKPVT